MVENAIEGLCYYKALYVAWDLMEIEFSADMHFQWPTKLRGNISADYLFLTNKYSRKLIPANVLTVRSLLVSLPIGSWSLDNPDTLVKILYFHTIKNETWLTVHGGPNNTETE